MSTSISYVDRAVQLLNKIGITVTPQAATPLHQAH